jgi:hypothetical protein
VPILDARFHGHDGKGANDYMKSAEREVVLMRDKCAAPVNASIFQHPVKSKPR